MCALHWATLRGHLDAVRLLLANGAFPNYVACREARDGKPEHRFTPLGNCQAPVFACFTIGFP